MRNPQGVVMLKKIGLGRSCDEADSMVGKDFESGLAAMKAAAESDAGKARK